MKLKLLLCGLILIASFTTFALEETKKYTRTPQNVSDDTPQQVLEKLQNGNKRFLSGKMLHRNYNKQAILTAEMGQAPYAVILSCMDSRGPVEILFDQGIGDVFSLRVAGNVLNQDNIGSLEYATKVIGAKVIVIMGHTNCGAVEAACKSVELGNLSDLLSKIKPAVLNVSGSTRPDCSKENVDKMARQNVINMVRDLKARSHIINELVKNNDVIIVGAMQNLSSGKIDFFDADNKSLHPET